MKIYLIILLFSVIGFASFAEETIVVFDGGEHQSGKTWVHPRGISKMEISVQTPYSNEGHLSFDVELRDGWAGAGWNWCSWKEMGKDLSNYKYLQFQIGVSSNKIKNLYVRLTSNNGTGQDAKGSKVMILPLLGKRNKYVKIKIPLEKLSKGDLNINNVWGINFEVFSEKDKETCKIFIDQIEFTD